MPWLHVARFIWNKLVARGLLKSQSLEGFHVRIAQGLHGIGFGNALVITANPTFIHGQAVAVVDLQVGVGGEFHRGVGPVNSAWKPIEDRPLW